jgi:Domain of unknown function (DUF4173)
MRIAALAAAVVTAFVLPGRPLGVGVLVVALLVAAAAWRAAPLGREALVYATLALVLTSMSVIRDAGWVIALDLAAAWALGSVAVSGARMTALAAPVVRLRDAHLAAPAVPSGLAPAARGALVGGLLVVPFGALFWTADAAFAELSQAVPLPSAASLPGRALAFTVVLAAALGLALTAQRPVASPSLRLARRLSVLEWAIPLVLLDALFACFVGVQFAVFFGGHDHVLRTAGLTYAEYARQGFWQLLAASALTLAVIAGAVLLADTPHRSHRVLRRALLGSLCLLTLVVLASALRRLLLYEDGFGLTRPRILAESFALWLGGFFVLLMGAGLLGAARRRFVPIALVGTAVGLLAFSVANPDGLIAERNIQSWRDTGRIDISYLRGLSADAAPAISELPDGLEREALRLLAARIAGGEPWSSFNLSRRRAREILNTAGGSASGATSARASVPARSAR